MRGRLLRDDRTGGGGDLSLGDIGHCGDESPWIFEGILLDLMGRCKSADGSTEGGGNCGLFTLERFRRSATGEGIRVRLGLSSWLFFRDRETDLDAAAEFIDRRGRVGEVSREEVTEFVDDTGADRPVEEYLL